MMGIMRKRRAQARRSLPNTAHCLLHLVPELCYPCARLLLRPRQWRSTAVGYVLCARTLLAAWLGMAADNDGAGVSPQRKRVSRHYYEEGTAIDDQDGTTWYYHQCKLY